MTPLLEVAVRHADDVAGALAGGADRLLLGSTAPGPVALQVPQVPQVPQLPQLPQLALVAAVVRAAAGSPVRVPVTDATHAAACLDLGVEGVVVGPLDDDLEIDVEACLSLAAALPGVPWTFSRAVDDTLDPRRSWRRLLQVAPLTGLTAVASAGSPMGLAHGYEALLETASSSPDVAALVMPSGGLVAEQVPWLAQAGVRQFAVDAQVRPGGSTRAFVDAGLVRSWRRLLDGTVALPVASARAR